MKKYSFVLLVLMLFSAMFVMAEESTLIDFTMLTETEGYLGQHQPSLVDYSHIAGTTYTKEEKAMMMTSLYVANWEIELCSSASTVVNRELSMVKPVLTQPTSKFPEVQVLGARIHFPTNAYDYEAFIKPPFDIPAYATHPFDATDATVGKQFENGLGVVKNVGVLKDVSIWVFGRNIPCSLSIVLSDENNNTREIFMGSLAFEGWKELRWVNPNYIADVRNRELSSMPMYPRYFPIVIFDGLKIHKYKDDEGGDIILYVKDIKISYDLAFRDNYSDDIDDEAVWGILTEREQEIRRAELENLGDKEVLRYLEKEKMDDTQQ